MSTVPSAAGVSTPVRHPAAPHAPSGALPGAVVAAASVCIGAHLSGVGSAVTLAVAFAAVVVGVLVVTAVLAVLAPLSDTRPGRQGPTVDRTQLAGHAVRASLAVGALVVLTLATALAR